MPLIVQAPTGFVRHHTVAEMFGKNLTRVQLAIRDIVRKSFETHPMRNVTVEAVRQRVNFCVDKAAELRRSLSWGSERIIDSLPAALRAHLDGRPWEPSKRMCWSPEDGD